MHNLSYKVAETFEREYMSDYKGDTNILDVGSLDVNGTYKDIFSKYNYTGLDIVEGKNVDIVSENPYRYPIDNRSYDVIVSGNTAEHVRAVWRWMVELHRILRPDGLICIITPHSLPEHRYPVDCWRILPDGMRTLFKHANLEVLEIRKTSMDTVGIGLKNK